MPFSSSPLTCILLVATVFFSYQGLRDALFLDRNLFKVGEILNRRQYGRLISSGFVHADWIHLFFNMYTLYMCGEGLELYLGTFFFSVLYFGSLIGGGLLSLFVHRQDPYYSALGASGAVNGVLFSFILLFPDASIRMFFIPVDIPSWLYAAGYMAYTMYGMRTRFNNIGHDAHMGGAVAGMLITLGFFPQAFEAHPITTVGLLVFPAIFLVMSYLRVPGLSAPPKKKFVPSDDHYNQIKAEKQKELDRILEKINASGMNSLTEIERRFLDLNT